MQPWMALKLLVLLLLPPKSWFWQVCTQAWLLQETVSSSHCVGPTDPVLVVRPGTFTGWATSLALNVHFEVWRYEEKPGAEHLGFSLPVLRWEQLYLPEDIWQCLETLGSKGCVTGIWEVESKDVAKHSTVNIKELSAPKCQMQWENAPELACLGFNPLTVCVTTDKLIVFVLIVLINKITISTDLLSE